MRLGYHSYDFQMGFLWGKEIISLRHNWHENIYLWRILSQQNQHKDRQASRTLTGVSRLQARPDAQRAGLATTGDGCGHRLSLTETNPLAAGTQGQQALS